MDDRSMHPGESYAALLPDPDWDEALALYRQIGPTLEGCEGPTAHAVIAIMLLNYARHVGVEDVVTSLCLIEEYADDVEVFPLN